MAWTEIWSMNLFMELKQMKTKDKEQVSTERIRMFAPFKNAKHYTDFHNAIINGIPKIHHWEISCLMQMVVSTWHEDPELAKELWK